MTGRPDVAVTVAEAPEGGYSYAWWAGRLSVALELLAAAVRVDDPQSVETALHLAETAVDEFRQAHTEQAIA